MKNKIIFALLFLIGTTLFSCQQEYFGYGESSETNTLAQLDNVIESYESGFKDELTPTKEPETQASDEIIQAIKDSMSISFDKTFSSKTRSITYGSTLVGVFKKTSCGPYGEFVYSMDCEDGGWSRVEGNVGATTADSNNNITFHFCIVSPLEIRANTGALMLTNYRYHPSYGTVELVRRYHDNEDKGNRNAIINAGGLENLNGTVGDCVFGENTIFTWMFSYNRPWPTSTKLSISYGTLMGSSSSEGSGRIHIDDENRGNKNWATRYGIGNPLPLHGRYRGISMTENTVYYLGFM